MELFAHIEEESVSSGVLYADVEQVKLCSKFQSILVKSLFLWLLVGLFIYYAYCSNLRL